MATPAPMPPAADDEDQTDTTADTGSDEGAAQGEQDEGTVIATLIAHKDGTYTVIAGDEDDAGEDASESSEGAEGDQTDAAAAGAEAGAAGDEGAASGEEAEPEQKNYDTAGEALKGILDILREHEASQGGEDEFSKGYAGEDQGGDDESPKTVKYQS